VLGFVFTVSTASLSSLAPETMIFCSLIAAGELVVKEAPVDPVSNITRTCTEISRKQQATEHYAMP
jgi:hypothetical protein